MPFQTGDSHEVGICTRLSSSGSYERFTIRCDTSGNLQYTWYRATANNTGTSPTYTFSAAAPSNGLAVGSQAGITGVWLRLNFDGTNRNLYMSLNGYDWSRLYQFTNTTFFGSNPDQYGIVIGSSSTSTEVLAGRYSSGLFTQP